MLFIRTGIRAVGLCTLWACGSCATAVLPHAPPAGPSPTALALRARLEQFLYSNAQVRATASVVRHRGLGASGAVRAFYTTPGECKPYWLTESGWTPQAQQALRLLEQSADLGLPPARYLSPLLRHLPDSLLTATQAAAPLARAELRLTDALLRYLTDLQRGHLAAGTHTPLLTTDTLVAQTAARQLHQVLDAPDLARALLQLQPTARAYRLLQTAWVRALHASPVDSARLMNDTKNGFRRVALNLERLRWAAPADSEYVVVNIPAYRLQLIKNERVVLSQRVIVGKPKFATPTISSSIAKFVVAPEWRVPYSIAVREFLPELQRDPAYLTRNNYHLYNGRNRPVSPSSINWKDITPKTFVYAIRQQAGTNNALGNVVFYFPNQHIVYLHDTPGRHAFKKPARALSHGCIRLETPFKLADYLLRREGRAAELPTMYRSAQAHQNKLYQLRRSLPIYLRYYTCETDQGRLVFLPDIYNQDSKLATKLFPK